MSQQPAAKEKAEDSAQAGISNALGQVISWNRPEKGLRLLSQLLDSVWITDDIPQELIDQRRRAAIYMYHDIDPKDAVEEMLAAQMVATHNAVMECQRRAMIPEQSIEGRAENLRHAAKLQSIYTRQMEALDKHRGKRGRKVTVERVNIGAGGQAVVGNIERGPGSGDPHEGLPIAARDGKT